MNGVTAAICRWLDDAAFAYSMTYDEGTVDALANALPVHQEFQIPGHVDVVPGQLGRQRTAWRSSLNDYVHMGVEELRFLIDRGWGVGNHSWSHYVYPAHPGLDLYREVVWSKYRLEDMIDHPVRIFTIPNDTHNYPPVIDLVKKHYLACAYIEGGPNREGFDLYKIGNFMVASGRIRSRPGWPAELQLENLSLPFLEGSWLYETSHLVMWNVPQEHKCVTPEYLTRRFSKLKEISDGRMWAAKPDDVVDYELMRRNLELSEPRHVDGRTIEIDVDGTWPVGVINSLVTLKVSWEQGAAVPGGHPTIEQSFDAAAGGYAAHDRVGPVRRAGNDWLVTMELAPQRTVRLRFPG